MEEEDIMEWAHLDPSMQPKVSSPLPFNKNTESTKSNTESSTESNTKDKTISKLCTKVQSLKTENNRLKAQIRYLKYRLRHVPKVRKTPKKIKKEKNLSRQLYYLLLGRCFLPFKKSRL